MFTRTRRHIPFTLSFLLAVVGAAPAVAALTPTQALERFFSEPQVQREWFAPSFLQAVPFQQIPAIRDQLTGDLGRLLEIREEGDRYLAVFEKGSIPAYVTLDEESRFGGLRLLPPIPRVTGFPEVMEAVKALPGTASLLVLTDGNEVAAVLTDVPLAVGSSFKLAILAALKEDVESGKRKWDDVVTLRPEWRSLPSGILQDWPSGAPITLHTLATLMISRSDNTAADALLHILGRARVEEEAPERNRPFLATREAFQLKSPAGQAARDRFLKGNAEARRRALDDLRAMDLPSVGVFGTQPLAIDIEWFFTARELCALMSMVKDLDLMSVNPGVAEAPSWARVAFKGGSEPGVMNLTTWVVGKNGREHCVCLTQNRKDAAVDETRLSGLASGILGILRDEGP
jgi:beta-lactamase class A